MTIKVRKRVAVAVIIGLWLFASAAFAQQVEVLWLGHSTFRITSTMGKVIVIESSLRV